MGNLVDKTYRAAQAAAALGVTPRQLWWLTEHVGAGFDHEGARVGWRRFSLFDVCRLALIRALMRYGCPAGEAAKIAIDIFDSRRPMATYKNVPSGGLTSFFARHLLIVENGGKSWNWRSDIVPKFDIRETPDTCVVIKVGLVVADVEDALAEWADGGD